jgi:hypothetical protein
VLQSNNCPSGNLHVQAHINGQWVPAVGNYVATSADINQTIQVRVHDVISNNYCWGYIHVQDKLAPVINCTNIHLTCAITNYTPDYLLNTLGIANAYPSVVENCGTYSLTYIDTYHDLPCNGTINDLSNISAYVERKWLAVDQSGNSSTCQQYVYFDRRHVNQVLYPADIIVDCSNPVTSPSATGVPYVVDFGQHFDIYPNASFCELTATYQDQYIPVCDGTHKILRTWTVLDWCLGNIPNSNPIYHVQLITVMDNQGPSFTCPDDVTFSTDPTGCNGTVDLPNAIITDNCSRIHSISAMVITFDPDSGQQTGMYNVGGTLTTFPGNNLWDRDTLGNWGVTPPLPIGTHTVIYTAQDDCGNTSTCSFHLTIEDQTPPVVACDQTTKIALGADGTSLVNASTFDDGSYDNCSPIHFKVRRMNTNTCQDNGQFHDQVKFCCSDIGDTIQVILRVYDVPVPAGDVDLDYLDWHSNDCMVLAIVEDKLKPICTPPANTTVSCENFDPTLWAYGKATATDNCCIKEIVTTANFSQFDTVCNRGTIVRTFRAVDCGGLSSQCTQRVIVNYNQNYWIHFPDDKIITVCDGTGTYGEPTFYGKDCELLGVSHEDQIFTVVPDACYKIERTWTIINWCTYNPNLPCITVPNPSPNATVNHPSNLPGPIVSPCGTTLLGWVPTSVKINSTDATPTNYCTFWDANANCYKYKQIIKIIDTKPPVVQCPASPVQFCDLTANDPQLWNESYWWDNVIGSHDLCEGPTDLKITGTDLCSGANIDIRYLLFLDLDGDGVMETVISSTTLPGWNTVNFNNVNNPNFAGGTPRSFDERPVPLNQKYGFAIQTTVNGNNKTGAVRWNTTQSPTTFTIPELPYGTHKIKWILSDGCGNDAVCEYTFVVKDCKAPTVVCLNGLSVNIMPTGMVQLWASDFLQYGQDNCTPADQLKYGIRRSGTGTGFPVDGNGNPITGVQFTCADLGTQSVDLWAIDKAGNADFCQTYVIVQDNLGSCNSGTGAKIAGVLKTEQSNGVSASAVQVAGDGNGIPSYNFTHMSDNLGNYGFNAIPYASNSMVVPVKDDNPLNGVTTYDLVLISKHILGIEPLGSPYKMIAADANKSGSITTFDIVELRKLILGIYNTLPANTSWRFVDKSFVFPNQNNPFTTTFPESIAIPAISDNMYNQDFVAVKVGDVNGSAIANSLMSTNDRSSGMAYLDAANASVKAGETVTVHFKTAEKLAGYQFTMQLNGLDIVNVTPGDNMTKDNFGVFDGALTASFEGEAHAFDVTFRANKSGNLSDMIEASSRITPAEAYDQNGGRFDVAFRFAQANGTVVSGQGFELHQNTPNPVSAVTNISFNLPEASDATLTITDAEGRLVKMVKGSYAKGFNTVTLQKTDLHAGVLFYQLDTPEHSASKKMIVIE